MGQPAEVQKAVCQYRDGLNALDADIAVAAFASNAVIRYPGMEPTDREGFRRYLEQVKSVLSAFHIDFKEMFPTEHGVAARWSCEATTKAGRTVRCEGIDSWIVGPAGTVQAMDVYYDPTPLQEALQG